MTRRPIDIIRESGHSAKIGSSHEGEFKENLVVGSRLYLIKERAIYTFNFADDIDPGRTNPNIPNVSQKAYDIGSDSEVVGRVLLQAKYLFEKGAIGADFDKNRLLSIAVDIFDELCHLSKIMQVLQQDQDTAFENARPQVSKLDSLPFR